MQSAPRSAVLITGTSTGIGFACAHRLALAGHRVFAGVRSEGDATRVGRYGQGRITPIVVDVTDQAQIEAAAQRVSRELGGASLIGLVNNAGVALGGPLELVSMEDFRYQHEVNVFGAVAMTKALLPALREARGRIVNISSVSGMVATPGFSPYASSKFALEAVTDALRRELRDQGVHACAVQPGAIQTAVWNKGKAYAERVQEGLSPELQRVYGNLLDRLTRVVESVEDMAVTPEAVAEVVEHALTTDTPRARYPVGPNARVMQALSWLPHSAVDRLMARL